MIDPTIHDRYVVFEHGFLFKLGRGLHIYKPAAELVGRTEIDGFLIAGFKSGVAANG